MYDEFTKLVQEIFRTKDFIPLHEPYLNQDEKDYLAEVIDSTFVSTSGGVFVSEFEENIAKYTGSNFAISTVNGTSALHLALKLLGVNHSSEVLTQSLTFIATCNSIAYCGASPIFIDVDQDSLSLSPIKLRNFLESNTYVDDSGSCINKNSNKVIKSCVLMNTFGFPGRASEISKICESYNISFLEDSAESLGSFTKGSHSGFDADISVLSFNGNKIITTGGGGMITTEDETLANKAKHLSTTARVGDDWNFIHDEVGYNYRMPNLNAAMGIAQLKKIGFMLKQKRALAEIYKNWFANKGIKFVEGLSSTKPNFWLNTIILQDKTQRDYFLKETNVRGVGTRPAWEPMHKSKVYSNFESTDMENTNFLFDRIINIPSSVIEGI